MFRNLFRLTEEVALVFVVDRANKKAAAFAILNL